MAERDWVRWHEQYEDPRSSLSWRLACVIEHIRAWLDAAPPGDVRLISVCAGQARDVFGALDGHGRADDAVGRLVELDHRLVDDATRRRDELRLGRIDVVEADGSSTSAYADAVPADLIVLCGVLGNLRDDDVARTIAYLPTLCARDATVLWTRHRKPPDLTPAVRRWFADAGFDEVSFDQSPIGPEGVGVHRFAGIPKAFEPDVTLFEFVGFDQVTDG